jgi:methionyl aminopeptidase
MISLRTEKEIEKIKKASIISAQALKLAGSLCEEGISSFQIDLEVKKFILSKKARPNFLHYNGYPNSCCISINDMVIHGIPSKDVILKKGDIVSIDVGAEYEGYNGDNAYTFVVGGVSDEVKEFLKISEDALYSGIEKAVFNNRVGDISQAIEELVREKGYGIVKEFVGHGVGENLHEEPEIPNFLVDLNRKGPRLLPGMVIAIEPMTTQKNDDIVICEDGWGVKTKTGELAAHFEHTVLITEKEPIILTKV